MGRLSRRFGGGWPAAAVVVLASAGATATALPAQASASWIAPVPAQKPEVPPLPGTSPPADIAVPGTPTVLDRSAPPATGGRVAGGTVGVPGPLPDFALAPLPVPEDPLSSRPAPAADPALADPLPIPPPLPDLSSRRIPAPAMRPPPPPGLGEEDTAALLVPPPDPGPERAVELPAGNEFSIVFDEGAAELEAAEKELLTGIAARMARNQTARLQIRSYATAPGQREPDARRVALRRAVDMRRLLVEQGVRSTRIDVRALGTADAGPTDRVDLVLVN